MLTTSNDSANCASLHLPTPTAQRGFTLTELVVTLAIGAILLALSAPSFRATILSNRIATHTNDVLSSLSLARSEAVKRGKPIVICKSNDLTSCSSTGDWEQGWILFVDNDNNAAVDAGSGDSIVRAHGPLAGDDTLQGTSKIDDYIAFATNGFTRMIDGSFQSGTLTFGLCAAAQRNTIVINNTGRARVVKVTCP
ncbi:prepilin-type N-terminal cleavage/methylation domain-containing protein [Thiorhodococcus mannitoliphagus]|uniref:Type II secretion system protein H n=1 Tax=Thiorhodococcus mannitoliphagus TaxID=329406 RepID=A0A6P1DWQ0_9GAMM|nr:Tfp pilus assembly protein FimT/FimU [Thiorhodococcus mannitoliphagus]NEX21421.1 prepilin-type N-terminal cleavage/methylation domain-containing protein [Thiorhodococcus mannitoliphagus]